MELSRVPKALLAFLAVTVGLVVSAGAASLGEATTVLEEPAGTGLPPVAVPVVLVGLLGALAAARLDRRTG